MDVYETHRLKSGRTMEIYHDLDPQSPREWDNMGTVACSHRRYRLSDAGAPNVDPDSTGCSNWAEVREYLVKEYGARVVLPIYMYDHGGITINTTGFSCPWDSGQVGFIYATADDLRKAYGAKRITRGLMERAKASLEEEIRIYDQYVTGDVYGFRIKETDPETGLTKEVDSCWGFFGDDVRTNGMMDHVDDALADEGTLKS